MNRSAMNTWVAPIDAVTLGRYRGVYLRAWLLSLLIMAIEFTGATLSGSFALRADVWHVAGDMLVAFAPVAVSYARSRHLTLDTLLLCAGIAVATMLVVIGGMLLSEARENLLSPAPRHEVHGWILSGFALLSAGANLWQHLYLSQVQTSHRDVTHAGFHFHVRMDLLKNLALPLLGGLIALNLVNQRADSWAAACIGAWIAVRGVALLVRSIVAFRRRELPAQ
jgi:Co/Zn/Cd efflux system component